MTPRPSVIVDLVSATIAKPTNECVVAPNRPGTFGYVQFWISGVQLLAHRYAYEQAHGPIPSALQIDHQCHDPETCEGGIGCPHRACINPAHLKPATPRENVLRSNAIVAVFARATHCVNGHPFDETNTYRHSRGRACRTCRRDACAKYRARRSA